MSDKDSKATRKAFRPVLARLDQNEEDIRNLVSNTRQSLGVMDMKVKTLQEVMNAVVEIVGLDKVQAAIDKQHVDELQKESDIEKKGLELAKEKGLLVAGEAVNARSVIVGHDVDPSGNIMAPGRGQLLFAQVKPELRESMAGKKVGEAIDTPIGGKFVIDEIWDVVAKPTVEEAAAKAVDAALGADLGPETVTETLPGSGATVSA